MRPGPETDTASREALDRAAVEANRKRLVDAETARLEKLGMPVGPATGYAMQGYAAEHTPLGGTNLGNRPFGVARRVEQTPEQMREAIDEFDRLANIVTARRDTDPYYQSVYDKYMEQQKERSALAYSGVLPVAQSLGFYNQNRASMGIGDTLAQIPGVPNVSEVIMRPAMVVLQGLDWAWENGVAEPLSAAWLVTDPTSTTRGDWSKSRDAANEITFGQAIIANPLSYVIPGIGALMGAVNNFSGDGLLDVSDPTRTKDAADDFFLYNLTTGLIDTGLNFMPIPGGKGVQALRRLTGMSTKVTAADHVVIADDIARHFEWVDSGGARGQRTNIGVQIEEIAASKDAGFIATRPLIDKQSGLAKSRVSHLATLTQDREIIAALVRTSLGDMQAAAKLVEIAPDIAFDYGRVGEQFRLAFAADRWNPTPEQEAMFERAFISLAQRDEFVRGSIDAFFAPKAADGAGEFAVAGSWKPMEGKGVTRPVARMIESMRTGGADITAARLTGNPEYLPGIAEKFIQTTADGPVIRLINVPFESFQWSLADRPLQLLTFSGTRPDDWRREFYAVVNQIQGLRAGQSFTRARSLKLGDDGKPVYEGVAAEVLREEWFGRLARAASIGGSDAGARILREWRAIEEEILLGMMHKYGVDLETGRIVVAKIRDKMQAQLTSLKRKGHFYNEQAEQVKFNPETIRQLADFEYTLPLNQIEQGLKEHGDFIRGAMSINFGNALRGVYDTVGAIWRTDMLLKPGYTFRNSMLEPGVSMTIAQLDMILSPAGAAMLGRGLVNYGRNTVRRADRVTFGTVDRFKAGRLNRALKVEADKFVNLRRLEYERLGLIRDRLHAEIDDYAEGPLTATVTAKKAQAEDDLAMIEASMGLLARDLVQGGVSPADLVHFDGDGYKGVKGFVDDILDVASGNSKVIARLERLLRGDGALDDADLVVDEKLAILKEIEAMTVDPAKAGELNDILTTARTAKTNLKKIKKTLAYDPQPDLTELARIRVELERVSASMLGVAERRARLAHRREKRARVIAQGEGVKTRNVRGQQVDVPEAFHGPLGGAYRVETSSGLSAAQTYNPSLNNNVALAASMNRQGRMALGTVMPTDLNYLDELYRIATRHFAKDPLFQRILTLPKEEALAWAKANPDYFKALGKNGKKYIDSDLDYAYDIVNGLFPTKEARDLIVSGRDFTSGEFQTAMLKAMPDGKPAAFQPINGQQLETVIPDTDLGRFRRGINSMLSTVWQYLAVQPETRMARWPYFIRQFEKEWDERAAMLADQGVVITPAVAAAQRQAAYRSSLDSLEKTFYNIRRYKNPVYSLRFVSSFPGAFFNSLYRYLYYLPTRHPGNMLATVNVANAGLGSILVDGNGNKVDFSKAEYIVVPMTGKGTKQDPGVRIPLDALTRIFVDNPARSWLLAITVDTSMNLKPDFDAWMREHLADGIEEMVLGEYGASQGDVVDVFLNTMLSGYMKTAKQWWQGEGSQEWLMYHAWAWQDAEAKREKARQELQEKGLSIPPELQGPPDEERDVLPVLDGWFKTRFFTQWASPVAYKTDAPGQYERDVWQATRDNNPGATFDELRELYFAQMGGDWVDPYTASTTKDKYSLTGDYSIEAWSVLKENGDLASELAQMDPSLVGLITMGAGGTYSRAVYNNLKMAAPFPGGEPMGERLGPDDLRYEWFVDQGWD
ncbi:MAG: hypothetical protein ACYCZR_07765, partial [Burkholderiales bacterium]